MAAISTTVMQVIAAMIEENFYQDNIWIPMVQDESSEIAVQGKSIRIAKPDLDTYDNQPKVLSGAGPDGAYSEDSTAAQLRRGTPDVMTVESVVLDVNKEYDIDRLISNVSEKRTRYSLMELHARHIARKVREQMNSDIRAEYDNAANEVQATTSASTGIRTSAANWGNAAHQARIMAMLRAAAETADASPHFFPPMGRVCVTGPANYHLIRTYLIDQKYFFTTGISDRAAANAEVLMWEGWNIVKDNSLSIARTNTDDANHSLYFMVEGYPAVAAAYELDIEDVFRSEDYRGTRFTGTMTWGHKIINDNKLLIQKTDIT